MDHTTEVNDEQLRRGRSSTQPDQVLEAKSNRTAHFTADGIHADCGTTAEMILRRVANAETFVTCSKCRKARSLPFTVGGSGKPEFNTGRRVFGR